MKREKKLLEELYFFIENQEYNALNGELLSFANTIQNKIKKLIESEINDLEDKKWTDSDLRATVSVVNNCSDMDFDKVVKLLNERGRCNKCGQIMDSDNECPTGHNQLNTCHFGGCPDNVYKNGIYCLEHTYQHKMEGH